MLKKEEQLRKDREEKQEQKQKVGQKEGKEERDKERKAEHDTEGIKQVRRRVNIIETPLKVRTIGQRKEEKNVKQ